jgi:membrane protein YqaA with SNARE-associated domain
MTEDASLWVLFGSSFLAATLLPGGSEAVLFAVLRAQTATLVPAIALATLGNTLGGLSSYLIGRVLPLTEAPAGSRTAIWQRRALDWTQRYGAPAMLGAWLPFIGDPLCVAAGWLRMNWMSVTAFMALGKLARYVFVAWSAL